MFTAVDRRLDGPQASGKSPVSISLSGHRNSKLQTLLPPPASMWALGIPTHVFKATFLSESSPWSPNFYLLISSQSWLAIESYAFCWRHLPPTPGFSCPRPSLNSLPARDPPLSTSTQVGHGFLSSLATPQEGRRAAPISASELDIPLYVGDSVS